MKPIGKFLLTAAAAALVAASLFLALAPPARAFYVLPNGNSVICWNGQLCGCITVEPPYNCLWTN